MKNFKLKISSHDFNIILDSAGVWEPGGMGRAYVKTQTINIDKEMEVDAIKSTLLHEIIHVISDFNHLELTEEQTSGLAIGLYSVFKDNECFDLTIEGDK